MTHLRSRIFFVVIFFSLCFPVYRGQQKTKRAIDSLEALIKTVNTQKEKNALRVKQLSIASRIKDTVTFLQVANNLLNETSKGRNNELKAIIFQSTGIYYYNKNKYNFALNYFDSACTLAKTHGLEEALMGSLMSRGAMHYTNQNYYAALVDYLESEKLMLKYKSDKIGGLYTNISMIYNNILDLDQSEKYLQKAVPFIKVAKDNEGLAKAYNNLGLIYKKRKEFNKADSVFKMGLKIARAKNLERDVSDILYNMVEVLKFLKKNEEALIYRTELYELVKKTGEPNWEKMVTLDMAVNYFELNDKIQSSKYYLMAEAIKWNEFSGNDQKADYYSTLADLCISLKKYKESAEAFQLALNLKQEVREGNSVFDLEQIKYQAEKQKDSLAFTKQKEIDHLYNEKINKEAEHKLSQQRTITFISIIVLLVIALFSGFLFRANRQKETANSELKEQKKIVTEKNKEITDSINYSQRIQQSLLPTLQSLTSSLPDHFLIYTPKDIVSGDFYWLKEINKNEFFIAVADCTGHGVPGAIMSALSIQLLNEISSSIAEPNKILNELNRKLKENLNQDEEGYSKDGLDICLCKINVTENKLYYSGANRNLWVFDNNGLKLEIKATKAGIGGHTGNGQEYQQHGISVEKNDLFLLSTDGFADQFGGDKMKKITTKQFKTWVAQTAGMTFAEKENYLNDRFLSWKNSSSQIDDICVLGFKFV